MASKFRRKSPIRIKKFKEVFVSSRTGFESRIGEVSSVVVEGPPPRDRASCRLHDDFWTYSGL
jgi:hypothetical protein